VDAQQGAATSALSAPQLASGAGDPGISKERQSWGECKIFARKSWGCSSRQTSSNCFIAFTLTMIDAFIVGWKRSFDYEGRSNRADYWWFVLANYILFAVLFVLGFSVEALARLAFLYWFASFVPHLSLTIRRLRDAGRHWAWLFISLVPFIGGIWLLVLLVQPSAVPSGLPL
jgi:uncharacterized membrane protein YhaH (DUF805 family)